MHMLCVSKSHVLTPIMFNIAGNELIPVHIQYTVVDGVCRLGRLLVLQKGSRSNDGN